jgi:carbon-monoxide dehydrogenase medium subunit
MYPPTFSYERAESVEHAVELLDNYEDREIEVLAGGHSLVPLMKSGLTDIETVVDIGRLDEIRGVEAGADTIRIGSLTSYAELTDDQALWDRATVIAEAAGEIGDVQVRSMGTIGGNLAHADPAADLPAAVLAADARLHIHGSSGERQVDVDDFFEGIFTTALESTELLTWIEVPDYGPTDAGAYVKKRSPSSGYAMVGVAAVLWTDGETIESARVAVNGVLDHAVRLYPVEEALEGAPLETSALAAAAEHAGTDLDERLIMSDEQASSQYRKGLLPAYTERALSAAHERIA